MGYRTAFYHDNRSNLTCVRDPQNGLTYYTYDAENRQTSVRNPWGEVTYYEYSPGGQMTKRTLGNSCVTYYRHDATGQTSKVENRKGDLAVISSFEYVRDALGNPLRIVREDGYATYYQYDAKSQLTGETQRTGQGQNVYAWAWDYDPAGNRTKQTFNGATTYYSYNAGNELTTETTGAAATYYQYDRCGNTTVQQAPGGTTYYHWNHENLLKQLDLPGNAHNYFSYDADSKRVTKQDSEGFTRFIYQGPDMLKLLQERDTNGGLVAHYTMGQGLEAMRRGTASHFYHFDWLGSTFELTDASGVVTDSYLYNAWGEVLARTGTTMNPHGYVGRERYYRMPLTRFYQLGLRYYASDLGRFWSRDPFCADPWGRAQVTILAPPDRDRCANSQFSGYAAAAARYVDPTGEYFRDASCEQNKTWEQRLGTAMKTIRISGVLRAFLCCLYNLSAITATQKRNWETAFTWNGAGFKIYCGDDATCRALGSGWGGKTVCCGHRVGGSDMRLCRAALSGWGPIENQPCDWPNIECTVLHESAHLYMPRLIGHKSPALKQCWPKACPKAASWTD